MYNRSRIFFFISFNSNLSSTQNIRFLSMVLRNRMLNRFKHIFEVMVQRSGRIFIILLLQCQTGLLGVRHLVFRRLGFKLKFFNNSFFLILRIMNLFMFGLYATHFDKIFVLYFILE